MHSFYFSKRCSFITYKGNCWIVLSDALLCLFQLWNLIQILLRQKITTNFRASSCKLPEFLVYIWMGKDNFPACQRRRVAFDGRSFSYRVPQDLTVSYARDSFLRSWLKDPHPGGLAGISVAFPFCSAVCIWLTSSNAPVFIETALFVQCTFQHSVKKHQTWSKGHCLYLSSALRTVQNLPFLSSTLQSI